MTRVLAFPFRIDPNSGQAASVLVGGQQEAAEAVAMLALVRLGERELCPGFGIPDPAYTDDVDIAAEVQSGLRLWGPDDVSVTSGSITLDAKTGVADVALSFQRGGAA